MRIAGPLAAVLLMTAGAPTTAALATSGLSVEPSSNPRTSVTLTADAGSDSTFGGWSGACTATGACTITMGAAESDAASFTKIFTGPLTASFTARAVVIHNKCGFIGMFNASAFVAPAGAPST
jgi:hypothetical protein